MLFRSEATDPWGIKVNRVELKNILPPREIQNAMEKQMKAERERRESILQAEGEKASKILVAEGEKQSAILKAYAAKQAKIMAAEAEAASIMKVQQALADAMRMLNENAPNDQVIMPLMPWAAHVLQWPVQRDATPRGGADPGKPAPVRIGGCNPPP